MKRLALNFLIIVALVFSAAITSCKSKKSTDVKLLERLISDDGTEWRFEYDSKNRIIKIDEYSNRELYKTETITYSSSGISVVREYIKHPNWDNQVTNFVINRQTITYHNGDSKITLTDDGYINEMFGRMDDGEWYLTVANKYQDGNLTTHTITPGYVFSFEYDDKMSPFRNVASPKWMIQYVISSQVALGNNITKRRDEGLPWYESTLETYQYEYDSDGFPIKRILRKEYQDDPEADYMKVKITTTRFIYRGEAESIVEDEITENFYDPLFDIYGTWEYVVSPSSYYEWRMAPPDITINSDNTVSALFYESCFNAWGYKTYRTATKKSLNKICFIS